MCESDWRTVTKSIFILHCISRDCSADSCRRFVAAIKAMSKVRNPKNPTHKYFDGRMVSGELDENSRAYKKFIAAYWAYVLHRSKSFSSKFDELKDLSSATAETKALAVLKKARVSVEKVLECKKKENIEQTRKVQHDIWRGKCVSV